MQGLKKGFLGYPSASVAFGLPSPSLSEKRNDGPENLLVLLRHLDEGETHIHKRARVLPGIEIGPHHLASDDDLLPVGKFEDQLVDLLLRELLLAMNENPAGSDISRFALDHALAGDDGDGPIHVDSWRYAPFRRINQIPYSLPSLTAFADGDSVTEPA